MLSILFAITVMVYLVFVLGFIFFSVCASLDKDPQKKDAAGRIDEQRPIKFSIVIPAYQEKFVLLENIEALLKQNYPRDLFNITIIADRCSPEILEKLRTVPSLRILEIHIEQSTKAKTLMSFFRSKEGFALYPYAIVLDADNVCHPDFLIELSAEIQKGYNVVQAQRVSKNEQTMVAKLDTISEIWWNFIRKATRWIDTSCPLIGSGFAIPTTLLENGLKYVIERGLVSEDRPLHRYLLLDSRQSIRYCPQAVVYDHKTTRAGIFLKQRARWIQSYLDGIRDGFIFLWRWRQNPKQNMVMSFIQLVPPYNFMVFSGFALFLIARILYWPLIIQQTLILSSLVLYLLPCLALAHKKVSPKIWTAYLFAAPYFAMLFVMSLFYLKKAKAGFLKTSHE